MAPSQASVGQRGWASRTCWTAWPIERQRLRRSMGFWRGCCLWVVTTGAARSWGGPEPRQAPGARRLPTSCENSRRLLFAELTQSSRAETQTRILSRSSTPPLSLLQYVYTVRVILIVRSLAHTPAMLFSLSRLAMCALVAWSSEVVASSSASSSSSSREHVTSTPARMPRTRTRTVD